MVFGLKLIEYECQQQCVVYVCFCWKVLIEYVNRMPAICITISKYEKNTYNIDSSEKLKKCFSFFSFNIKPSFQIKI